MTHSDDWEDRDPGLARERTRLAWLRTAIAFGAVGIAVLRTNLDAGLAILPMTPVIWLTGHMSKRSGADRSLPGRMLLIAGCVTAIALVALIVVLLGHGRSQGFRPPGH
jgi:uncharacterized membrane protein YidH (DUF202 family)